MDFACDQPILWADHFAEGLPSFDDHRRQYLLS
jgi:hypothetical protein